MSDLLAKVDEINQCLRRIEAALKPARVAGAELMRATSIAAGVDRADQETWQVAWQQVAYFQNLAAAAGVVIATDTRH